MARSHTRNKRFIPGKAVWLIFLGGLLWLTGGCGNAREEAPERLPVINEILYDTNSAWYLDPASFPDSRELLPIGVFGTDKEDITAVEVLLGFDQFDNITGKAGSDGIRDFAGEYIDFVCRPPATDSARIETIKNMAVMFRREGDRPPVKALVVAGDPASVIAFEDILELIGAGDLGVVAISILEAGVEKTLHYVHRFHSERNKRITVGVIASESSLAIEAYDRMTKEVEVVFQGFTPDSLPSLNNPLYPLNRDLIRAYHFDYSRSRMNYRGSRYNPGVMEVNSPENAVRYAVTSLVDQLQVGSHPPLKYILTGENTFSRYPGIITEQLTFLRNFRQNNRYIYRHLIDPEVVLINPREEAAEILYQALRGNRLAAFRTTPSCVRIHSAEPVDLSKYPLLNVCINH
jgi:hypothetical protein